LISYAFITIIIIIIIIIIATIKPDGFVINSDKLNDKVYKLNNNNNNNKIKYKSAYVNWLEISGYVLTS
jgi:ABC-type uncharacterized transport system permease subunit